jgi:non-ribosomal peptide synthetase component E (peptide arylation enzyme)
MTEPLDYLDLNVGDYPNKEALVDSKNRLTFLQVKQKAERLALEFIELGLIKGQVVVIQLPNIVEYFLVRWALQRAGLVGLYMGMNVRHQEMEFVLNKTKATGTVVIGQSRGFDYFEMTQEMKAKFPDLKYTFVVGDTIRDGAISIRKILERPLVEEPLDNVFAETRIKAGELSEIRMTSGTTGFPKLSNFTSYFRKFIRGGELSKRFKVTNKDIFAALAPLTGGGSGPPCKALAQSEGCKVVMLERFDAEEALKLIEREGITFASGVPAQLNLMVNHPNLDKYDLSSLRIFYYAGATIPYSVAEEVEDKMDCRIVSLYGGLDIGFQCTTSFDDPPEVRRTSVGKLITPRVQLKLIDEKGTEVSQGNVGRMVAKNVFKETNIDKEPESTRITPGQDGWYDTGDLAWRDKHDNIYIVGRSKDVIIRGGQNIYPAEIESVLITHPEIKEVAIVAMPDPIMGEKACAFVTVKHGSMLDFEGMTAFLITKKMAKYKLPERLEIIDHFPMSGDGQKISKKDLVEQITNQL